MFTASHLPFYYNGLKFFLTREGGLESSDIRDIIALVDEEEVVPQESVSTIEVKVFERYSNHLVGICKGSGRERKPLSWSLTYCRCW